MLYNVSFNSSLLFLIFILLSYNNNYKKLYYKEIAMKKITLSLIALSLIATATEVEYGTGTFSMKGVFLGFPSFHNSSCGMHIEVYLTKQSLYNQ